MPKNKGTSRAAADTQVAQPPKRQKVGPFAEDVQLETRRSARAPRPTERAKEAR